MLISCSDSDTITKKVDIVDVNECELASYDYFLKYFGYFGKDKRDIVTNEEYISILSRDNKIVLEDVILVIDTKSKNNLFVKHDKKVDDFKRSFPKACLIDFKENGSIKNKITENIKNNQFEDLEKYFQKSSDSEKVLADMLIQKNEKNIKSDEATGSAVGSFILKKLF